MSGTHSATQGGNLATFFTETLLGSREERGNSFFTVRGTLALSLPRDFPTPHHTTHTRYGKEGPSWEKKEKSGKKFLFAVEISDQILSL